MDETNPITQTDFMQAHIEALENQLAEKDAMIGWLADKLEKSGFRERYAIQWIKLAQEAVNKDD